MDEIRKILETVWDQGEASLHQSRMKKYDIDNALRALLPQDAKEPAPSSEKALRERCEALVKRWDSESGRESFAPVFAEELLEALASSPAPDDILMSAVTGPISYPEPAPEAPK
jgi:hypothetical protein